MDEDRYDKDYTYGSVEFHLADFMPDSDQCRYLVLKVLEQAVRDYVSLSESEIPNEQATWEEAKGFLYDDEYHLVWGTLELTTEQFLDLVDLDISWVREQTMKKFKQRNE
jgi:hypothetical protein